MKSSRGERHGRVLAVAMTMAAVAAMVIVLAGCGGGGEKSDEDAIRDVINKELDSIHDEDWGALFELQSPDRREACDRDGWESAVGELYGEAYEDTSKVEYEVDEIVIDGDGATVTLTELYDGEEVGTDDFEYAKVDGEWHSAETNCPGGSARATSSDDDPDESTSGDDDIASLREVLARIADDGSDADLDSALEMKDTMTRYLMRVRAGADQSTHYYLDDAWSTFMRMAESDSESLRSTAAFVQADVVVGYIDDAEEALERAASAQTRTANASRTPAISRTPTVVARPTTRATVRSGSPTTLAGTPAAGRPDGPYGTAATITVTFDGQTIEFAGGRCTITGNGRTLKLDLLNGADRFDFGLGGTPSSTLEEVVRAGAPVGITMVFYVGPVQWITTRGDGMVVEIAEDLESGTFTGPFFNTGGLEPIDVTGSFSC